MIYLHVNAGITTVVKDMEHLLPFQCGKCGRWKVGGLSYLGNGEHGNDAGFFVRFFTLLNLGIQGGHITTDYVAVN